MQQELLTRSWAKVKRCAFSTSQALEPWFPSILCGLRQPCFILHIIHCVLWPRICKHFSHIYLLKCYFSLVLFSWLSRIVCVCLLLGFLKTIVSSVRQFINLHIFRLGYDVLSFGFGGMCFSVSWASQDSGVSRVKAVCWWWGMMASFCLFVFFSIWHNVIREKGTSAEEMPP